MANPEQHRGNTEKQLSGVEQAAQERLEHLKLNKEAAHEGPESHAAKEAEALHEAKKEALASPEMSGTEKAESHHNASPKHVAGKKQREKAFRNTMRHIQQEMPPVQRVFSKVIHSPIVEKASDAVGGTIARPNAILSGSICAFVLVLALYINARHMGYALSGFETIGAFLLGWALGVLFDLARVAFRNRR